MKESPLIFVSGAGFMGSGIAQTAAAHGTFLTIHDLSDEQLAKSRESISWSANKLHEKNPQLWPSAEEVLKRIIFTTRMDAASEAEVVIEAIAERFEIKAGLFGELDKICPRDTLFFSNTSAISIGRLAATTGRAAQFCGMHFFSPVPLMKLVEVIRGEQTSDATISRAMELARAWGKSPVEVRRDVPGFIVNRLLIAMAFEAVRLLEGGVASVEDIDAAMKLGCAHRMGPLETMDMSGLDIFLHAGEAIYEETSDPKYQPPELLRKMVSEGRLGRKTGRGFLCGNPS